MDAGEGLHAMVGSAWGRVLACNGFARGNGSVVAGRALPLWPQLYPSIEKATTSNNCRINMCLFNKGVVGVG